MNDLTSTVSELVQQANDHHQLVVQGMQTSMEHAAAAGNCLLQAKAKLGHGEWEPFVRANCNFSPRTARAYMQVAKNIVVFGQRPEHLADLS